MVYTATSAAAAVGGRNPNYYLERQGIYAALGIVLMMIAQRWDYRRLMPLAPMLVLVSLVLLVAVLAVGAARSTAPAAGSRSGRPCSSRPSSRSSRSRSGLPRYLSRRQAPRTLRELWRPLGLLDVRVRGAARARARPRHDDRARADADRACWSSRGRRCACSALAIAIAGGRRIRRDLDQAVPPRALLRLPAPVARRGGHRLPDRAGADRDGLRRHLRRRARPGRPEDLLPARGAHRHDAREHRRGARPDRRHRR